MTGYTSVVNRKLTPDLAGQRFTRLVAIERDFEKSRRFHAAYWACQCDCGNLTYAAATSLLNGGNKSCGCLRNETIVASRYAVKLKFVPESINGHAILLVEVPGLGRARKILARCGGCDYERWVNMYEFLLKGGQYCRTCLQRANSRPPRFTPGDIIGNFTVLAAIKPAGGGFLYTVQDMRCGHERQAKDNPTHPFLGSYALCGCPVRMRVRGYVHWCWTMPDGKRIVVQEHRIVMEQMKGRQLYADENVHHVNGVRDDNRPENLELWSSSQPSGQRVEDKIAWAAQLLDRYSKDESYAQLARELLGGLK